MNYPNLESLASRLRQCETMPEFYLYEKLKSKAYKGYDFFRQMPLGNYIVDIVCDELKLAIDIDGDTHDLKYAQGEGRNRSLREMGFRVLRFTHNELKHAPEYVLGKIYKHIDELEH